MLFATLPHSAATTLRPSTAPDLVNSFIPPSLPGIGPNAFTLSSTVAACGRRQQWLKALLLHAAARREAAEAAVPTPSELVGAGVGALARAECWCPGAEGRGPAVRQGRRGRAR